MFGRVNLWSECLTAWVTSRIIIEAVLLNSTPCLAQCEDLLTCPDTFLPVHSCLVSEVRRNVPPKGGNFHCSQISKTQSVFKESFHKNMVTLWDIYFASQYLDLITIFSELLVSAFRVLGGRMWGSRLGLSSVIVIEWITLCKMDFIARWSGTTGTMEWPYEAVKTATHFYMDTFQREEENNNTGSPYLLCYFSKEHIACYNHMVANYRNIVTKHW